MSDDAPVAGGDVVEQESPNTQPGAENSGVDEAGDSPKDSANSDYVDPEGKHVNEGDSGTLTGDVESTTNGQDAPDVMESGAAVVSDETDQGVTPSGEGPAPVVTVNEGEGEEDPPEGFQDTSSEAVGQGDGSGDANAAEEAGGDAAEVGQPSESNAQDPDVEEQPHGMSAAEGASPALYQAKPADMEDGNVGGRPKNLVLEDERLSGGPVGDAPSDWRGTQSAPVTPTGSRTTMRSRRAAIPWNKLTAQTIAQRRQEEQQDADRLLAAIEHRGAQALYRRGNIVPSPQSHAVTPVTFVVKTRLPGLSPPPSGWKQQWESGNYKEMFGADDQIIREQSALQNRERDSFNLEICAKQAEDKAVAERNATEWEQREARKMQKADREAKIAARHEAILEEKMSWHSRKIAERESHKQLLIAAREEEKKQKLEAIQELRASRQTATLSRLEYMDHVRSSLASRDHSLRDGLRAQSDQTRSQLVDKYTSQVRDRNIRTAETANTGYMRAKESQDFFQRKYDNIASNIERNTQSREAHLAGQQDRLSKQQNQKFSKHQEHSNYLDSVQRKRDSVILKHHNKLHANIHEREAVAKARNLHVLQKGTAILYMDYWAKEIDNQFAIRKEIPQIRPDVQKALDKFEPLIITKSQVGGA